MGWAKDFAEGLSGGLAQPIKELVSEFIVDKDKAAELSNAVTMKIMEQADKEAERASQKDLAQLEINKVEAASGSLFVAGGRPAAIWVCVGGVFQLIMLFPLVSFLFSLYLALTTGTALVAPAVDTEMLFLILSPLLGLGGYRTYEKLKGVHRDSL